MIIEFGSLIWHVVLDLIGITVAFILLIVIGTFVYGLYKQYMKHVQYKRWFKMIVNTPNYHSSKKDGGENGTKEN